MSTPSVWTTPSHPGVYDDIGRGYLRHRRPDARIAEAIEHALAGAARVCNVGAGAGAYEPVTRSVTAVEPSREMLRQRGAGSARAIRAVAEALPFRDESFDAVLAILTVHHWLDIETGLRELRRIAPRRVIFHFDLRAQRDYWLVRDYLPEIATHVREPLEVERVAAGVGATRVEVVPVPHDCSDGFLCAYWRRPEAYLDAGVRACISAFAQLDSGIVARGISRLEADLDSGTWHARYAELLGRDAMDCGYRLIVSDPAD